MEVPERVLLGATDLVWRVSSEFGNAGISQDREVSVMIRLVTPAARKYT